MKKKLLSLIAMAFVTIGMQAQTWTRPTAEPEGVALADHLSTTEVKDTLYLYNVAGGGYLGGGNAWGTQSSIKGGAPYDDLPYFITYYDNPEEIIGYQMFSPNSKATKLLGRESAAGNYIDFNNQGGWGIYWSFEPQENGYYRIRSAEGDPNWGREAQADYDTMFFGWVGEGTIVASNVNPEEEGVGVDWLLVTPDAKRAFASKLALLEKKQALYSLAERIVNEDLEVDYEKYTEAFNSEDGEVIDAAYDALYRDIQEYLVAMLGEGATPNNPADFTSLLVNPTFEGDIKGWTCTFKSGTNATNIGYQSAGYTNGDVSISKFIEAWAANGTKFNPNLGYSAIGDAELEQIVKYLPAGKYSFTVDCIAVQQYQEAENPVTGVQLFATGGEIDKYIEIHTGNGLPEHYELTFASTGGDLTLGLRTRNTTANWIAADNFTLSYMGPVDPWQITLETYLEEIDNNDTFADIEAINANATVKETLNEALSNARDVVNEDEADFKTAYQTLVAAIEALNASVADYKRLGVLVDKSQTDAEAYADIEGLGDEVGKLAEQYEEAYNDGTASKEEIDQWMANYDTFLAAEVRKALPIATEEKPLRINPLGLNLDYAENSDSTGWVVKTGSLSGTYKVNNHNGEVWQNSYSCLQTIADLPAGKYVIKARAFERTSNNANGYDAYIADEDNVTMYLVANENKVKVKDHAEGAIEQAEAPATGYVETIASETDEEGNIISEGSGIWLPNSQAAAEWAFNNTDFYQNEISTYLVADGDLVFGTRNDDITEADDQWNVWTDFEIFYYGKSQSGLYEQMMALAEQAGEMQNDPSLIPIAAGEEKLNAALNAADAAKQTDSEETLTGIINDLTGAMAYITEGQTLASQLADVFNVYDEKYASAEFFSTDETFPSLMSLDSDLSAAISNETFDSNEQIQGWIDALPVAWIAYVMGQEEVATATEENPADITSIIFNSNFDGGNANYWTVDPLGQNNGYQNNSIYTNDTDAENPLPEEEVVTLDQFIECWRSGAILTDGAISQKLGAALPEGAYILQVEGHAVCQMGYPEEGIQGVNLTVTDGTKTWATPMGVPEGVSEARPARYQVAFQSDGKTPVTIGIFVKETNVNWIAADNFMLFYVGKEGTAVEGIAADQTSGKAVAIYNLAGQRVQKAVRGLYIINGKKMLVK